MRMITSVDGAFSGLFYKRNKLKKLFFCIKKVITFNSFQTILKKYSYFTSKTYLIKV